METGFADQLVQAIPELRSYAISLMRDRTGADDLVQETLERALTKQALYVETGPIIRWLSAMMRNLFIDQVRRKKHHDRIAGEALENLHRAAAIEATQEDRRFITELEALLARIPPNDRNLIVEVAIHGLTYHEAADRLTVRLGAIGSRLSRTRSALWRQALTCASDGHRQKTADPLPKAARRLGCGRRRSLAA